MKLPNTNLWQETLNHPFKGSKLNDDVQTDVIVIGGGYTGLSAALHIAQQGKSVCVLEAQTIGYGGSGRNVGYVNAGLWTPPDDVEELLGKETGMHLNTLLAKGPDLVFDLIEKHQIQCSATRKATLHYADTASGLENLKSRYAQQVARNAPVHLLDRDEAVKRTGSDKVLGALMDMRAGTIQPLAYVQGLAKAAEAAGAKIFENTRAERMHRDNGKWVMETPSGRVTGNKLIQATNAYGVGDIDQNEFIPVNYFQMATAPLTMEQRAKILPEGEGCWDCADIMSSFRVDEDGRLLIGGLGDLENIGKGIHQAWAERKMASLFPELAGLKFEHAWSGRISFTSDHLPKVVSIGENAVSIYGYSGRGISPGTVFGKCAADWAVNDNLDAFPIPITQKTREPMKKAKAAFYEMGAVLAHLISVRINS